MLKITILISKDYDIDIYKISRYIAKMIVLLSPNFYCEVFTELGVRLCSDFQKGIVVF